jgi:hypothetical protein
MPPERGTMLSNATETPMIRPSLMLGVIFAPQLSQSTSVRSLIKHRR